MIKTFLFRVCYNIQYVKISFSIYRLEATRNQLEHGNYFHNSKRKKKQ